MLKIKVADAQRNFASSGAEQSPGRLEKIAKIVQLEEVLEGIRTHVVASQVELQLSRAVTHMGKHRLALVPPADKTTGHDRLGFIFAAFRQRRLDGAEPLLRLANGAAPVRPRRIGIDAAIAECLDFRLADLLQLREPHAGTKHAL